MELGTTRVIQVWWYNREKHATYEYASEALALEHYNAFVKQDNVQQVCLADAAGNVIALDGILNGRHEVSR